MHSSKRIFQLLLLVSLCGAGPAIAQSDRPRVAVGANASFLRLSAFDTTSVGFGGRVSFDLTDWAAIEGEAQFFPKDDVEVAPSSLTPDLRVAYRRRRVDAFAGVKLGVRGERIGLFAKVRPGLTRLSPTSDDLACTGSACPFVLLIRPEYRTEFAFDVGGVLEFYPTPRMVPRLEIGDTIVWHRSIAPPCGPAECTTHNLMSQLGVGFRF